MKIILTSLFIFLLVACNTFKEPEYRRVAKFEFTTFTFSKIEFKTELVMYNPNNIGIDMLDSEVEIFINDKSLGKSEQANAVRVNKISEFAIPIKVMVPTGQINLGLLKSMWGAMQKGKVNVKIKGVCRLRKGGIPFNFPINYSENIKLEVPNLF
jgi:LEA14-like dessication related protein